MTRHDDLAGQIAKAIKEAGEPLETKELQERLKGKFSRSKLMYRLQNLRADGAVRGKFCGPGKGVWIWWYDEKK